MRQSIIYKVSVSYANSQAGIPAPVPVVTYYSNLKRTIEAIQTNLAACGWEAVQVNYSAVYRALKERNKFVTGFYVERVRFFQLTIEPEILNPPLTTLGIDKKPTA